MRGGSLPSSASQLTVERIDELFGGQLDAATRARILMTNPAELYDFPGSRAVADAGCTK
jgi:hypothetical protein